MPRLTIPQTINGLRVASADKTALTKMFNALVDDIETLRANQRGIATKLDADVGVTDTNYAATFSAAPGSLAVGK